MVIPGGRFREVYYWDTYWIIKGLLICHMFDTAKGMLLNFFNLVQNLGHIPNGTRKYYIGRSQPPLMTMMVEEYLTRTGDFAFVKENIHHLDAEMTFWYNSRRVRVYAKDKAFIVYRYYSAIPLPRPESYREDKITASGEHTEVGVNMRYISIRSAAESGWDFSTRWLIFQGENLGTLNDCATMFIIPVDLNAFMHYNYKLLTDWHARIGNTKYVQLYNERAQYQQFLLDELFWNPTSGIWLDYDAFHERPRDYFYLSNFVPLWTKSYTKDADTMLIKLSQYIDQYHFENFQGGFPTSVYTTTEQWDYPNSWPPLQVFLIQGLGKMDTPVASKMAKDYATLWVHSNYQGFIQFDSMFEKYDCMRPGEIGGSGEYKAQEGFGWTNAIVLELLEQYPDIPCISKY
ncbi:hypothetical protein AAG570_001656 [Ranatra chinensis]|uniref:Trehalase n=1 Tax=Ranatra chinensis TaxID=642074 RepID=A0ABD0Y957_9HEMI